MPSRYLQNFWISSWVLMPRETYHPALFNFEQKAHMGQVSQILEVPRELAFAPVICSIRKRSATVEWLAR